ncbi:peptide chain release factor N(5)-glutamine methyltransferase [Clostridium boliviensis]|uniref:Release factor glutamine methyltransferase n=1 Tax=Clostridium boliviensis TaxID=318465 RepID=A0ABU4GLX6_9CLOT|nr:peptide chain release factor N(5)-glutamine methyltransferase [Clostridium boliviensis]MDW2798620.1 peptide chain release factor N(5)-glutamine methyltransferase [Clostridium boliviensis]
MTLNQLLDEGTERLSKAGVEEAALDARYLLLEAFHTDLTHFLIERNRELKAESQESVREFYRMLELRSARIPLQQITGSREFMGLNFFVNEHVLIPRQDTETLAEQVLMDYKGKYPRVLDLCTGSGCIAISLAKLGGFRSVVASDISAEALKVAQHNGEAILGKDKITFLLSDLFNAFRTDERFDVIVSNPPYIPTEVIRKLQPEVRDHEPMLALDGKEDGLYFYRRLAEESSKYLNPGGTVYFEIGYDQKEAVSKLLAEAGFTKIRSWCDAAWFDRVVSGVYEK